jgi:hypothetical protein
LDPGEKEWLREGMTWVEIWREILGVEGDEE